jgi:predicted transglutaminase-like cysteine proteinase
MRRATIADRRLALPQSSGLSMARRVFQSVLLATAATVLLAGGYYARPKAPQISSPTTLIAEASPSLAPFQHVRFCLRYPEDCKSDPTQTDRIELNADYAELLKRVNQEINTAIAPTLKSYGAELKDGWTIAPAFGDCNDYAVTKRHELLQAGLPARALRLAVVKTASGIGHLILVVSTTKGEMVLDNLNEVILSWQSTDYHWIKIQSANDARFWFEVKAPVASASLSHSSRKVHMASQQPDI